MVTSEKILVVLLGTVVAVTLFVLFSLFTVTQEIIETEEFELWYTEAPFGVMYIDTSGHFILASGSISTELSESYLVKYWKDDQLLSLSLDAEETPVVVDGTFKMTITEKHFVDMYGFTLCSLNGESSVKSYVLHLPTLPESD